MLETIKSPRCSFSPTFVRIATCGLILIAVFAIYRQCVDDQFIEFDDGAYVFRNEVVRSGLSWRNINWALTTTDVGNWHPLTWWAYMLDVELFDLNAGGHVLTNIVIHGLAAMVLFVVLERISGSRGGAAFVALVFAVHPANVECVAWVSEKKSVLSALFAFLALGAYWHYGLRPTWWRYVSVVLFYLLSLAAKPMMVSLPLLVLLLDFWPLRRAQWPVGLNPSASNKPSPHKSDRKTDWKTWLWLIDKLPLVAMALAVCIVTSIVQFQVGAMGDTVHMPWSMRITNALFSYVRYLGLLLWPHDHALLYPFPPRYPPILLVSCALGLFSITWYVLRNARRTPSQFVGWFWFLITLIPVIGLVQVGSQSMADRYLYIPMIGPVLWMAIAGHALGMRWPATRRIIQLLGASWIAALAISAWTQASFWINCETIMRQAIANTRNNFVINGALGTYFYRAGRLPEAELQFREALKIKPENAGLLASLATALGSAGRYDEAIELLQRSLRLKPKEPGNHNNLGIFYIGIGKIEDAIHEFTEAIRLKPDYAEAKGNLVAAIAKRPAQTPTTPPAVDLSIETVTP